jgi:hypothetical protein
MDDQKLEIFNSIATFITDLNTGFGKKYKPVALYNRLIEKTTLNHDELISRHINAFRTFFSKNKNYISNQQLSDDAVILYSDRVYIDIGKILHRTDHDSHHFIYQHLVTIFSLLNIGTDEGRKALEHLSSSAPSTDNLFDQLNLPDTKEGDFIKNTLGSMVTKIDHSNPMGSMMSMMQSGFFNEFMGSLQNKMETGELSISSLLGTVTGMVKTSMVDSNETTPMDDSLKTLLDGALGNLNSIEIDDPELKTVVNDLRSTVTQVTQLNTDEDVTTPDTDTDTDTQHPLNTTSTTMSMPTQTSLIDMRDSDDEDSE